MILGIFFPIGDTLDELQKHGKLSRLLDYYLPAYKKKFEKIYIFSYGRDENYQLPPGCILVANKWGLHRFIYAFLMPIKNYRYISGVKISRVLQLSGIIPALITKAFCGTKVAVTYGYDYRLVEQLTGHPVNGFLYYLIEKLTLPFADVAIFSSQTIQKMVGQLTVRTVYLPNGIDMEKFRPSRTKTTTKTFSILTQSRLSPEKNLDKLIKGIARTKIKAIKLTIIGSGPLKLQLQQQAKKLGVKLAIIDSVSNDDMPPYYNNCHLYVHPSLTEGSSKALIEAAACGCAILAADIPQNRETLGSTGARYFELPGKLLTKEISLLLDNPQVREKLGSEARRAVQEKFDIKEVLRQETAMLRELV